MTTISYRQLVSEQRARDRVYDPAEVNKVNEVSDRPRTRGDCAKVERPCPYVGCKYHIYIDVTRNGGLKFNFPDRGARQAPSIHGGVQRPAAKRLAILEPR